MFYYLCIVFRMWHSFDLIYDKPYCRIAPYIIGSVLGYILYKTGDRRNFLNWVIFIVLIYFD